MNDFKICPKCQCPNPDKSEYCVCGHKLEEIPDILKQMFGDNFDKEKKDE